MTTQEINGVKYLEFEAELPVSQSGLKAAEKMERKIIHFQGIVTKMESVSGGFWGTSKARFKFLIPETNVLAFSRITDDNFNPY